MARKSISIYYQNVRGLRTKTNKIFRSVLQMDFDIVCLSETWLNDGIFSGEIFDSRFNVYRCDRNYTDRGDRLGGGVLVALKSEFTVHSSFPVSVTGAAAEKSDFRKIVTTHILQELKN